MLYSNKISRAIWTHWIIWDTYTVHSAACFIKVRICMGHTLPAKLDQQIISKQFNGLVFLLNNATFRYYQYSWIFDIPMHAQLEDHQPHPPASAASDSKYLETGTGISIIEFTSPTPTLPHSFGSDRWRTVFTCKEQLRWILHH